MRTIHSKPKFMSSQTIFCDESGRSGENLLDRNQQFLAYSAIAIGKDEADEYVQSLRSRYSNIQGPELKFAKLIRKPYGQEAISEILETFKNKARVTRYNKRYNLACKFYRYFFEPRLANELDALYQFQFQLFLPEILYQDSLKKHSYSNLLLLELAKIYKEESDVSTIKNLFKNPPSEAIRSREIEEIRGFCHHNSDWFDLKIDQSPTAKGNKPPLDLEFPAFCSLLLAWGNKFEELDVFYDSSKEIESQVDTLQAWVKKPITLSQEGRLPECNLRRLPQSISSQKSSGIQIADIFAGVTRLLSDPASTKGDKNERIFERWKAIINDCLIYPVTPSPEVLYSNNNLYRFNRALLSKLHSQAVSGNSKLSNESLKTTIAKVASDSRK